MFLRLFEKLFFAGKFFIERVLSVLRLFFLKISLVLMIKTPSFQRLRVIHLVLHLSSLVLDYLLWMTALAITSSGGDELVFGGEFVLKGTLSAFELFLDGLENDVGLVLVLFLLVVVILLFLTVLF